MILAEVSATRFATQAGRGPLHSLLVPGLVPDGPETFLRQRALFRAHGASTTATYPYEDFDLQTVVGSIQARVRASDARGELPVLVGVSVGGGFCIEALRRAQAENDPLPIAGLVLISPFTCTADLAPLLKRIIDPIFAAHGDKQAAALERGRDYFHLLASRSIPRAEEKVGWRKGLTLLTPSGLRAHRDRVVVERIERTLRSISTHGAVARVTSLGQLPGISGPTPTPLATAPTLILWGSKERQTLSMDGPGTSILCRPDRACRLFPKVEVQWVYDRDGGEVPHASLLKHAGAFNPHLKRFLHRIRARELAAVG